MTTEKHGIELDLKQNVDRALKAAAKAAGEARSAVGKVGEAAGKSFEVAGMAVVVFNQGLELAKKGMEIFRATIGASIAKAMEFRKEGDEMTQFFKDLGRESELVAARFGDVLMPVFRGFIEATEEATGKLSDFVWQNRQVIQTNLIEWVGTVSKALVTGLARSIEFVGKVWLGWKAVINVIKIAVNEYMAFLVSRIESKLKALVSVAEFFGASGIAGAIEKARASVGALGDEFKLSSKAAQDGLADNAAAIDNLGRSIDRMETKVKTVIETGMVNAQKRAAEATRGTTKNIDEQREALEKLKAAEEAALDALLDAIPDLPKGKPSKPPPEEPKEPTLGEQATDTVIGAMGGPAGSVASGFASGGFGGAAIAALGEFLASSEGFAEIMESVNDVMLEIFDAVEPVIVALKPVVDMLLDVLLPIVRFIGDVIKEVAKAMLRIGITIANAWNGILDALLWIFRKLGDISIFGKHPLGFLKEWADDLDEKASISTRGMQDALDKIENGVEDIADGIKGAGDSVENTVDDMTRSLINVPGRVQVALHEFRAADKTVASASASTTGAAAGGGAASSVPAGGTQMNVGVVNVQSNQSLEEILGEVDSETRRTAEITYGVDAVAQMVQLQNLSGIGGYT